LRLPKFRVAVAALNLQLLFDSTVADTKSPYVFAAEETPAVDNIDNITAILTRKVFISNLIFD